MFKKIIILAASIVAVLSSQVNSQELLNIQAQGIPSENILLNGGFESGKTSWLTTGTATSESNIVIKGKKSLKIVLANQILNTTQDSTRYATQFSDGVQGLLTVRIKTLVSGLRVCARQAGVINTSLCVSVPSNGKWSLLKIPFILGAGSNGVSINSNGVAVSGTVYVDDASLGAQDVKQEVTGCNDVKCETEFSARVSASGVISSESLDWVSGNASIASTSFYTLTFNTGVFSVTPNCLVTPSNSSSFESRLSAESATSLTSQFFINNGVPTATSFNITCQKQGIDFTNAKALASGSVYTSNNADTDWASCGHTTSSFTGFGTVSAIETQCKRDGGDLLMKGKFTSGVSTAVEARLSLPIWNGSVLVSKSASVIPSIQLAGLGVKDTSGGPISVVLIEPSVSYVTFSLSTPGGATNALAKANGNIFAANGQVFSINARIPISGWENSNGIIGSFLGMVTSQGSTSPDIQSVYFGSGANCTAACTTGNCTICNQVGGKITSVSWVSTGVYNLNGIDGTKYNCVANAIQPGVAYVSAAHDRSSSALTFARVVTGGASAINTGYNSVTCIGVP